MSLCCSSARRAIFLSGPSDTPSPVPVSSFSLSCSSVAARASPATCCGPRARATAGERAASRDGAASSEREREIEKERHNVRCDITYHTLFFLVDFLSFSSLLLPRALSEEPDATCRPFSATEAPAPKAARCILGGDRMWGTELGEELKRNRLLL